MKLELLVFVTETECVYCAVRVIFDSGPEKRKFRFIIF